MLLEFSCSNYKSIMNKVRFSFLAGKDDTYEDELISFPNFKVLRSAVIYGPNGSGKSNFLDAIRFMKELVIGSINNQPGDTIAQYPHKLKGEEQPTDFLIQFIKNDIRYVYGFSIQNRLVIEEYLYYFPKNRKTKIFERKEDKIQPGDKYKSSFEISYGILKRNRLFLSCIANYTNLKEIEEAFLFFKEDIVVYNPYTSDWLSYSMKLIEDIENKRIFLDMLNALDIDINDINVEFKKVKESDFPENLPIPSEWKSRLLNEASVLNVKLVYEKFATDLMEEESTGIQRLFELIGPIIDILNKGKILICDEIETGLHESIVCQIVSIFKKSRIDKFAQLLFTTHDTSLLDSTLFRRDQIWFTELDSDRATDLYSLAEIRNVRKTENLKNGYIMGKYRAIPMIGNNIQTLFDKDK